jgi:lipopolysaccharide export system protein LptC
VKPRANTVFPLALLVGLAGLSFWLERAVQEHETETRVEQNDPDFIVENFTAMKMDKDGKPASTLKARRMKHYPETETSELEKPFLVQLRDSGPPVNISADRGLIAGSGDEVRLYGNVVVSRQATEERPELRLETRYLQVFPEQDLARTTEHVVITQGRTRLTGVGMEVNSKTEEFVLKSKVSGVYVKQDG